MIDERSSSLVGRFDAIDQRLEQLEEKSESSRNRLYRHIDEKWSELFVLISSLDQKYVSREAFEIHGSTQAALQKHVAVILELFDTRSERIAEAVEQLATTGKGRGATAAFLNAEI